MLLKTYMSLNVDDFPCRGLFLESAMSVVKLISVADVRPQMRLAAKRWTSQAGEENRRVKIFYYKVPNSITHF